MSSHTPAVAAVMKIKIFLDSQESPTLGQLLAESATNFELASSIDIIVSLNAEDIINTAHQSELQVDGLQNLITLIQQNNECSEQIHRLNAEKSEYESDFENLQSSPLTSEASGSSRSTDDLTITLDGRTEQVATLSEEIERVQSSLESELAPIASMYYLETMFKSCREESIKLSELLANVAIAEKLLIALIEDDTVHQLSIAATDAMSAVSEKLDDMTASLSSRASSSTKGSSSSAKPSSWDMRSLFSRFTSDSKDDEAQEKSTSATTGVFSTLTGFLQREEHQSVEDKAEKETQAEQLDYSPMLTLTDRYAQEIAPQIADGHFDSALLAGHLFAELLTKQLPEESIQELIEGKRKDVSAEQLERVLTEIKIIKELILCHYENENNEYFNRAEKLLLALTSSKDLDLFLSNIKSRYFKAGYHSAIPFTGTNVNRFIEQCDFIDTLKDKLSTITRDKKLIIEEHTRAKNKEHQQEIESKIAQRRQQLEELNQQQQQRLQSQPTLNSTTPEQKRAILIDFINTLPTPVSAEKDIEINELFDRYAISLADFITTIALPGVLADLDALLKPFIVEQGINASTLNLIQSLLNLPQICSQAEIDAHVKKHALYQLFLQQLVNTNNLDAIKELHPLLATESIPFPIITADDKTLLDLAIDTKFIGLLQHCLQTNFNQLIKLEQDGSHLLLSHVSDNLHFNNWIKQSLAGEIITHINDFGTHKTQHIQANIEFYKLLLQNMIANGYPLDDITTLYQQIAGNNPNHSLNNNQDTLFHLAMKHQRADLAVYCQGRYGIEFNNANSLNETPLSLFADMTFDESNNVELWTGFINQLRPVDFLTLHGEESLYTRADMPLKSQLEQRVIDLFKEAPTPDLISRNPEILPAIIDRGLPETNLTEFFSYQFEGQTLYQHASGDKKAEFKDLICIEALNKLKSYAAPASTCPSYTEAVELLRLNGISIDDLVEYYNRVKDEADMATDKANMEDGLAQWVAETYPDRITLKQARIDFIDCTQRLINASLQNYLRDLIPAGDQYALLPVEQKNEFYRGLNLAFDIINVYHQIEDGTDDWANEARHKPASFLCQHKRPVYQGTREFDMREVIRDEALATEYEQLLIKAGNFPDEDKRAVKHALVTTYYMIKNNETARLPEILDDPAHSKINHFRRGGLRGWFERLFRALGLTSKETQSHQQINALSTRLSSAPASMFVQRAGERGVTATTSPPLSHST